MPPQGEMTVEEKLDLVLERMDEMAIKQASMAEIILAWNNAKGFVKTVQMLSKIIRWLVYTGVPLGALWYFVVNGHWPKG